ncbi:hypothetical protein BOX15_Mlig010422g1, partial [Macrostomum lignano]
SIKQSHMTYGTIHLVGNLASIFSILSYLPGLKIMRDIILSKSSESYSLFPYVAMLASSSVWLKYGLVREDFPLITVSCFSLSIQTTILFVFYLFARHRGAIHFQLLLCMLMVFPVLSYVRYSPNLDLAIEHLGVYCTAVSIVSYGSPLSAMSEVLRTKSSESMSLSLIMLNFITACLWLTYGTLVHDSNLTVPNFVGACLSCFQLGLICVFPSTKSAGSAGAADASKKSVGSFATV